MCEVAARREAAIQEYDNEVSVSGTRSTRLAISSERAGTKHAGTNSLGQRAAQESVPLFAKQRANRPEIRVARIAKRGIDLQ